LDEIIGVLAMPEFFSTAHPPADEETPYRSWLKAHPQGLVLNLRPGRDGRPTLHTASCQTLSYDLAAAGQKVRSGKVCCETEAELASSLATHGLERGNLNTCGRCYRVLGS
jgi:hypothetical protein